MMAKDGIKVCTRCGISKSITCFGKCKCNADGLQYVCKSCRKLYRDSNKELLNRQSSDYYYDNREVSLSKQKQYYQKNKEKIAKKSKIYRNSNKERIADVNKLYRKSNKARLSDKSMLYYKKNKTDRLLYLQKYYKSGANYETYCGRLTVDELPRLAKDGVSLEVLCKYCNGYFIPTNLQIQSRVSALDGLGNCRGDCYLYCSNYCKESCPTYGQELYPKGFKKATSREVDPLIRQLCFERDNWRCQICGATQKEATLHCHHIEGYTQNPRLGNDVVNCITLCKECHKDVHKLPGCSYSELRCNNDI